MILRYKVASSKAAAIVHSRYTSLLCEAGSQKNEINYIIVHLLSFIIKSFTTLTGLAQTSKFLPHIGYNSMACLHTAIKWEYQVQIMYRL